LISRRRQGIEAGVIRRAWRPGSLWRQAVAFACIAAVLMTGTPNAEATTYNPVFYYYHTDSLGSSNVLTDRSGNVVQHYEYATFGQTSFTDNNSAFPVSNRYTGQIADDETGLYYYGGRYYDPGLGRFIQPDPDVPDPTDSQSLNRYSYCRNNPLNTTDPTGYDDDGGGDGGFDGGDGGYDGGGSGFDDFTIPDADNGYQGWYAHSYDFATYQFQFLGTISPTGVSFTGQLSYVQSLFTDDGPVWATVSSPQFSLSVPWSSLFPAGSSSAADEPSAPPAAASSATPSDDGWLAKSRALLPEITNAAAWVSMVPGPVGTVAGLVNAAGEAFQGHWGAAAVGAGVAVGAAFGAGILTGIGRIAREALPELEISASKYPALAENILHAQKAGHPDVLTHGGDYAANRAAALKDVPKISPFTRDEYPFARSMEGGEGSWIGHIPKSQNDAQGALIANLVKKYKLKPGDQYRVIIKP
jgi:RHS repeat-associated protein